MRASSIGLLYGIIKTAVPMRVLVVDPAKTTIVAVGSSKGSSSGAGNPPVALYGYLEPNSFGHTIWSASQIVLKPADTATVAKSLTISGFANDPYIPRSKPN